MAPVDLVVASDLRRENYTGGAVDDANSDQIAEQLAALLRGHRPADEIECGHQLRTLDWLMRAQRPFDRDVFEPGHATGSGFVAGEDGRVGLIFHSKLKLWCQPGGHAEAGETDIAAVAARETAEELGVPVAAGQMSLFDIDVHTIAPTSKAPTHLHFDFRFLAVIDPVELPGGSDALDARWFTRAELAGVGLDAGLRRMLEKAVAAGVVGG